MGRGGKFLMEKVGLLAGVGHLPVEAARMAANFGLEVYAVALLPGVDEELKAAVKDYAAISVARIGEIIDYLKEKEITKVTMLAKELLFSGGLQQPPDETAMRILASLPDYKDDTIMNAFVAELAKNGMTAFDQTMLIRMLLPQPGVLTKREPSEAEKADMEFGLELARAIGGLDVGQTVVVKDRAAMALEAIEGTDACIRRGGELARGGAVVCKAAKPNQDLRFDVPTVGTTTIESMIASGCKALAIEAGKTLLVDRSKVIALADENDIAIAVI